MKRLLYILLSTALAISVSAQNQETINVTGQVTALSSASGGGLIPVSDVIVKLTLKGRILTFGTTDTKGYYSLRVEELKEGAVLSFAHISYEAKEVTLKPTERKKIVENMVLVQKSISLKEVKVRANPLLLKGDTLSYNLASFLGKGDVTLEDGLKRLPGVEVAKSGAISYMGKGISAFNIEGLAMSVQAQTNDSIDTAQFAAIYDYIVNTSDDEGTAACDSIQMAVQVGQRVTKSMPMSCYLTETGSDVDFRKRTAMSHNETMTHMPTVWINHPEGETTVHDVIFPKAFEGNEPTPSLDWTLTDGTLSINGFLCSRAEITFRGVRWTAWYTEEVPSSAGPWRLRGLPGLIVKATGDAHTFTLKELRREASTIRYASDIKIERMKYPKLLKYRNEVFGSKQYPKNPAHHLPTNTDMGIENVFVTSRSPQSSG